jgi:hypothetical protein
MRELPAVTDLSSEILQEIGRVIVLHSHLEELIARTVFTLVGIDPKRGRIAIRVSGGKEVLTTITDLALIAGIKIETDLSLLRECLDTVKTQRDQLAHGIWLRDDEGRLYLRILTGSWQPTPKMIGKIKRKISPEGAEYGVEEIVSTVALIEGTIDLAKALFDDVTGAVNAPVKKATNPI